MVCVCVCPFGSRLFVSNQLCGPGGVFVVLHVKPPQQRSAQTTSPTITGNSQVDILSVV